MIATPAFSPSPGPVGRSRGRVPADRCPATIRRDNDLLFRHLGGESVEDLARSASLHARTVNAALQRTARRYRELLERGDIEAILVDLCGGSGT